MTCTSCIYSRANQACYIHSQAFSVTVTLNVWRILPGEICGSNMTAISTVSLVWQLTTSSSLHSINYVLKDQGTIYLFIYLFSFHADSILEESGQTGCASQ